MKEGSASGASVSRPFPRSLSLRPDDSLTIRKMALSIGFQDSVSFPPCYPSYRALAFALVRLFLTEYASLPWTHLHAGLSRRAHRTCASAYGGSVSGALAGWRFESSLATRASPSFEPAH